MIYIWLCLMLIGASVLLPILRVFGVIKWDWKIVFAPIWAPILLLAAWFLWFAIPIAIFGLTIFTLTGGVPI